MARRPVIPQRTLEALRPGRFAGLRPGRRPGKGGRRRVVTPFLVMKLTEADTGQRPVMQAPQAGMGTIVLRRVSAPAGVVDFDLKAGATYAVSARVWNLGRAPALLGLARLYILNGDELAANWGKAVAPFDVASFSAWPGRAAEIRFRREWVPPPPGGGVSARISVFIHVEDMGGDRTPFVVGHGHLGDRRMVRDDFRLLP